MDDIDRNLFEDIPREWNVFFGPASRRSWWTPLLAPGFEHVCAASWFASTGRWVFFDPARAGTQIMVLDQVHGDLKWGGWNAQAVAVLRVQSRRERLTVPPMAYCVGSIKALLGVRSRALLPRGLFQHLVRHGAEIVRAPERVNGPPVRERAESRPGRRGRAAAG